MLYSVDRIEGDLVVLVDDARKETVVSKSRFDEAPREGDRCVEQYGRYRRNVQSTAQLRAQVNDLLDSLLHKI
ncbi:MAG: DUF3006 domain-containing protein [Oscillospiraceae bacterium]|nr:DUF3006 domain-containing protein [Oscillospiraceae bacterium]